MHNSVEQLPFELDNEVQGISMSSESLLFARCYEDARKGFSAIYQLLLEHQPPEKRYHKGYALYELGFTYILDEKPQEALQYFVLAYIEDLLSQDSDLEDRANKTPAGRILRYVYKVTESSLQKLKETVSREKQNGNIIKAPDEIFKSFPLDYFLKELNPVNLPTINGEKRVPGMFYSEWEKRIFIGGSYLKHYSEIIQIKETCRSLGYDPVIAFEFVIPSGLVHHHSLMLLHSCCKAIFEVTEHIGQLMEIERLRDYEVKPLIICQANASISEMLVTLFRSQGYELKRYAQSEDMETLVKEYLLS